MKRSTSEPSLTDLHLDTKRTKLMEVPNSREYLQLALTKVLDLQREIKEDLYTDTTSDHGDSENEEDTMKAVLIKVFKDLPGSSQSTVPIIENAMRRSDPRLNAIRSKSVQLAGYDTCRRVTMDFMKNVVKFTPTLQNNCSEPQLINDRSRESSKATTNKIDIKVDANGNCPNNPSTDYEIRMRMLKSLDLHLAVKQRDYIAKLMRQ